MTMEGMGAGISRRSFLTGVAAAAATLGLQGAFLPKAHAEKVTLRVFTAEGQRFGWVVDALAKLYKDVRPEVEIALDAVGWDDYWGKSGLIMTGGSAYDLLEGLPIWAHKGKAANAILPLSQFMSSEFKADYEKDVPEVLRIQGIIDGTYWCVTNDGNASIGYYRTDVFEEAGLGFPKTYSEAIETAKKLQKPPERYGLTVHYQRGHYVSQEFMNIVWSHGQEIFDAQWHPTFANETGERALELMKGILQYADPNSLNANEGDAIEVMQNGQAAFSPQMFGNSVLTNKELNPQASVTRSHMPPAGEGHTPRPMAGGLMWFVMKDSKYPEEAWKFAEFMTSREVGDAAVKATANPARLSILSDPKYHEDYQYFKTLSEVLPIGHPDLMIVEVQEIKQILGSEIHLALVGEKSSQQALGDATRQVEELLSDAGSYD